MTIVLVSINHGYRKVQLTVDAILWNRVGSDVSMLIITMTKRLYTQVAQMPEKTSQAILSAYSVSTCVYTNVLTFASLEENN